MHRLLRLPPLSVTFIALVLSGCLVAAESDVEEAASPMSGGGSGGGGSGGGGELIGVAQQAVTGCCCELPLGEGKAGKCRSVDDASQCKYEEYREGACNAPPPPEKQGTGGCSVSGAAGDGGTSAIGSMEGFGLLFGLALGTAVRRRRRLLVPSGAGGRLNGIDGAPMTVARG